MLEDAKNYLRQEQIPFNEEIEVGAMIEVPAAVMLVDELASLCDFLAIGTNDLSQYMLAISRDAPSTLRADLPHPALLRALSHISSVADRHGIDVCLCGEWASEPEAIGLLLETGLRELSVSPRLAPAVRTTIARLSLRPNDVTSKP